MPEGVYCCLTRTTLFTTMFTVFYCGVFIEKYVFTKFRLDWLLCEGHICLYRNVWPEAVYCCFTRNYIVYQIVYMFL